MHSVLSYFPILISSRHLELDSLIKDHHYLLNTLLKCSDGHFSLSNVKCSNRILQIVRMLFV
jgi:hypothetical protein